jgi:hypothetical protein
MVPRFLKTDFSRGYSACAADFNNGIDVKQMQLERMQ